MPPLGSTLSLEAAPLFRRLAAFAYDFLLIAALHFCFTLATVALRLGEPVPPGTIWFPLALLAVTAAYFCGFWVHGGQTVGMRAWRIRVVRDSGGNLGWGVAIARFCAGLLGLLPAGLGFWWSLGDSTKRAWHDRWTHTRVVRTDGIGAPNGFAPQPRS